ncbi:MAG: DeoR family transcriptional regulator, partial [Actinobacteria bacterium]|nr:DeoR family transcriptional regulator [Actinomycetota bacterium]
ELINNRLERKMNKIKKRDSILRNSLIGNCFFLIKYIEQWGTGINRMIKECLSYDLPEPLFEEIAGNLVVTFRKYKITEEILKELKEQEKLIVNYILSHKRISRKECTDLLKVSPATAFRYFKSLENKGIIKREGKGKNIYYMLK